MGQVRLIWFPLAGIVVSHLLCTLSPCWPMKWRPWGVFAFMGELHVFAWGPGPSRKSGGWRRDWNQSEISTIKYATEGQARMIDLKKDLEACLDAEAGVSSGPGCSAGPRCGI
jgi:hypothetical protein